MNKNDTFMKWILVYAALWMTFAIVLVLIAIDPELAVTLIINVSSSAGFVEFVKRFRC